MVNPVPEQALEFAKANLETAVSCYSVALTGAEMFADLQLKAARQALADSAKGAGVAFELKDPKALFSFEPGLPPVVASAVELSRSVYDLAAQTQARIAKLVENRVVEIGGEVMAAVESAAKNAPAGSEAAVAAVKQAMTAANSAYDSFSKMAKQMTDIGEANVAAATKLAKTAPRKKAA